MAGPILTTGSLCAPTCSHLFWAHSCAKRLCWNRRSLWTHLPFPLQQQAREKKKLSFFTNKSSRCRLPQQLLALPFLRSCLLPESIGKERRGKSIVTRENDLGLSRNLLCIMRPHQVPVPSYILLTWLKLNLWQEICLPASKNPAHMMHNLVEISVNSSKQPCSSAAHCRANGWATGR